MGKIFYLMGKSSSGTEEKDDISSYSYDLYDETHAGAGKGWRRVLFCGGGNA